MLRVVTGSSRTLITEVPDDEAPLEANLAVAIVGCRDPDDWYKRQERIDPLQRVFGVVEGMQH